MHLKQFLMTKGTISTSIWAGTSPLQPNSVAKASQSTFTPTREQGGERIDVCSLSDVLAKVPVGQWKGKPSHANTVEGEQVCGQSEVK